MNLGLTTALISLLDMLVRAKPGTCDQRFWPNGPGEVVGQKVVEICRWVIDLEWMMTTRWRLDFCRCLLSCSSSSLTFGSDNTSELHNLQRPDILSRGLVGLSDCKLPQIASSAASFYVPKSSVRIQ